MATNYTDNYQLCQWVKSDQVLMEEFNQDNLRTDQALFGLAQALETKTGVAETAGLASQIEQISAALAGKADTGTVNGQISQINQTLAQKADSSTVAALSSVVQTKADISTVNNLSSQLTAVSATIPRIAFGSYVGDGQDSRTISLPFAPKAVLVLNQTGYSYYSNGPTSYYGGLAVPGSPVTTNDWDGHPRPIVEISGNGFKVYRSERSVNGYISQVASNLKDQVLHYFAIG